MKNEIKKIPVWAIDMLTRKGYMDRFFYHVPNSRTNKEAFYKTEQDLDRYLNQSRYKDYNSFKKSNNYWKKKTEAQLQLF
jgi:hypothetical protein